jgi:site-specific DNA recombinase
MARALATKIAVGYMRVSSKPQEDGYSLEEQERAIRGWCEANGYLLILLEKDVESGGKISRVGYQRVIAEIRKGRVDAVVVNTLSRLGRNGGERLARAQECDRLGVRIVSVVQGDDVPGLVRYVYAGMDEERSKEIAQSVRGPRDAAVRDGIHCGPTPYGFRRRYAEQPSKHGRFPAAQLVADESTAGHVRRLFARYAYGPPMSMRQLAVWANSQPELARPAGGGPWSSHTLEYMLRNPVYIGRVSWNKNPQGRFVHAGPGDYFTADGRHDALIDVDTWEAVQARLAAVQGPPARRGRSGSVAIAAGRLVCSVCGERMALTGKATGDDARRSYYCSARGHGRNDCPGEWISVQLAHAALLEQVRRLDWRPWDRAAVEALANVGEQDEEKAGLIKMMHRLRAVVADHAAQADQLAGLSQEIVDAHLQMTDRLRGQLAVVEEQVAAAGGEGGANIATLEKVHQAMRTLCRDLQGAEFAGDEDAVRKLIAPLVAKASIAERTPVRRSKWVRLAVEWSLEVGLLLQAGLLVLGPDVPRPDHSAEQAERQRARWRAHYARKRAAAAAITAGPSTP